MVDKNQDFIQNKITTFQIQNSLRLNESDQESIETDDSNYGNKLLFNENISCEIDVQPKKRIFESIEDKQRFINDYQQKLKTELCKNWQIKGTCSYGAQCSFAHGYHELHQKQNLKPTYKTIPCKKFFMRGFCSYGRRCQYIHSDLYQYPQFLPFLENIYQFKGLPLSQLMLPQSLKYQKMLKTMENQNQIIENDRLQVFKKLESIQFTSLKDFFQK